MKLYIIGNGFDLEHGLPARYSDFASFCKTNAPNLFELINKTFPNITTDSLWSNFEEGLGVPNPQKMKEFYNDYTTSLNDINKPKKDEFLNLFKSLQYELGKWIISIRQLKYYLPKRYNLDKNDYYLTFNYTDILEFIYQLPKSKIKHIHGFAENEDLDTSRDYIFWHGQDEEESYEHIDSYDYLSKDFKNSLAKKYNIESLVEFLNEIQFKNNVNLDIIVLGHSMNPIDDKYFRIIIDRFSTAKWHIFYFDNKDCLSKMDSIMRLRINDFELYKS